ncbi:MAG: hypothetical protein H0V69_05035, partial [Acidimicrobiia bacterium]|nr:hypothetical protein [Acidimicrobiia bacterium]
MPAAEHARQQQAIGENTEAGYHPDDDPARRRQPLHPPGDGDDSQREHHDDLASRPPPAMHREGHERGVEPSCDDHRRQQDGAWRAAAKQGG